MRFFRKKKQASTAVRIDEPTPATVRIVDRWDKSEERYAPGVLIEVMNGSGMLREEMVDTKENTSHMLLFMGEQPLAQLQGDEYFCPTCEKILKSAYGMEQSCQFREMLDKLNEPEEFPNVVESISPLLKLLRDGTYILLDTRLYPTDGNGHLFWNVPNLNCEMPGTCIYYYGNGEWGHNRPYFTVGTQPYEKMDRDRVEDYMRNPRGRALAYHMDGYMTSLIDGHHKAMAAARQHRMLDALVIIPCYMRRYRDEDGTWTECVGTDEFSWRCAEYGIGTQPARRLNEDAIDTEKIGRILSSFSHSIPGETDREMCELAAYYPDVQGVASIDLVGEITEQRLEDILAHRELIQPDRVVYFLRAMVAQKDSRSVELFDFFMHQNMYSQERYYMVKEIVPLNAGGELTDYLVEVMVEFEDDYPEIKDLILDHV